MEWRSSKRFSNPFKPLDLSPQTTSELETLAEVFVSESIRTYEHFLLDENSQVDDNRWKFIQELLLNDVYGWNERCAYTSGTEISLLDELN
ncbi:hypothetical protein PF011_g11748 [Phytophthora fragariae]|uniref:Uncharacterized protein n=1 Tax=Phytophthora fragariae TaxID=53985 RepID=A0A6A3KM13_9STRA|nr:hypothetical protein PF011_g11748 [Phytophthora fragariae]